ncbi:unnamed protein product [Adineta steineri]|uniref:Uncharacterized protein n=1 Tax=Adineta steineri TaxID=433720 RepID=A0A813QAM0_9BILA|nr:unnamed protein product [Adineta steineri]CAF1031516.1 unnamed protein product [Adineta steineri]
MKYHDFEQSMNETKLILTENFVYKLFHIHELKLTKLSLIIADMKGVGKVFLLNFYSSLLLLNSNIINASIYDNMAPLKLKLMRLDNNDEINVEISNIYHPHIEDTFNESLIYIQPQSIIPVSIGQEIQAKTIN